MACTGGNRICPGYDRKQPRACDLSSGASRIYLDFEVRRVRCQCNGTVKSERLSFLADNPHDTQRFAWHVARRCRESAVKDIADTLHLDWHTVKDLDKQYMRAQLERLGTPAPKVIGIDEISIRKGVPDRVV
ncbi:MAG: helix-turn-helix domain-containing protein [Burkholderia sp.]